MFKVTRISESRLDIEMSGKLNSEQMKNALDNIVIKSEGIESGSMLYEIVDFHLPSIRAIGIEFSRLPSMSGLMKKFNRAAVLTDKAWLKMVTKLKELCIQAWKLKLLTGNKRRKQKHGCQVNLSDKYKNKSIGRRAAISNLCLILHKLITRIPVKNATHSDLLLAHINKILEIIRLHDECNLTKQAIARALNISQPVVKSILHVILL